MVGHVSNTNLSSIENKAQKMNDSNNKEDGSDDKSDKPLSGTETKDEPVSPKAENDKNSSMQSDDAKTSEVEEEDEETDGDGEADPTPESKSDDTQEKNEVTSHKSDQVKSRSSRSLSNNSSSSPEPANRLADDANKSTKSDNEDPDFRGFESSNIESLKERIEKLSHYIGPREDNLLALDLNMEEKKKKPGMKSARMSTIYTPKRAHRGGGSRKSLSVDVSNPDFKKPFEYGWVRELVYRRTSDNSVKRNADIYYYTPSGKKVRSSREILEHLTGDLTVENFTFFKEPIGVNDQSKEIIREAKSKPGPRSSENCQVMKITPTVSLPPAAQLTPRIPPAQQVTKRAAKQPKAPVSQGQGQPSSSTSSVTRPAPSSSIQVTPQVTVTQKPENCQVMKITPTVSLPPAAQLTPRIPPAQQVTKRAAKQPKAPVSQGLGQPSSSTSSVTRPAPSSSIQVTPQVTVTQKPENCQVMKITPTVSLPPAAQLTPRIPPAQQVTKRAAKQPKAPVSQGQGQPSSSTSSVTRPAPSSSIQVTPQVTVTQKPENCQVMKITPTVSLPPAAQLTPRIPPAQQVTKRAAKQLKAPVSQGQGQPSSSTSSVTRPAPSSSIQVTPQVTVTQKPENCQVMKITPTVSLPPAAQLTPRIPPAQQVTKRAAKQPKAPVSQGQGQPSSSTSSVTRPAPSSSIQVTPQVTVTQKPEGVVSLRQKQFLIFLPKNVNADSQQGPSESGAVSIPPGLPVVPCDPPQQLQEANGPSPSDPSPSENPLTNGIKRANDSPAEDSTPVKKIKPSSDSNKETDESTSSGNASSQFFMMNVNAGFITLVQAFQYLKVSELLRASRVSKMWQFIASHHSLWETVRMKNSRVSDWKGFGRTLSFHGTKYLDLRKMLVPDTPEELVKMWDDLLKALMDVKTLVKIDMGRCSPSALASIPGVAPQLESLVSLAIKGNTFDLLRLSNCKNLKELKLKAVSRGFELRNISSLTIFSNLNTLALTTIKNLSGIENCLPEGLISLELGECSQLSPAFATNALPKLTKLKRLRLEKGQNDCPTIALLQSVAFLKELKQLELINFDIKTGFEKALSKCTNLRTLLIIPTYVTQSASTNHVVMGGVAKLSHTLTYFIWGFTVELLKVTDLYIAQENEKKGGNALIINGDSIPILRPSADKELKEGSAPSQVDIVTLPNLERVLSTLLPTTKIKILKVPASATWRQTVTDAPWPRTI